MIIRLIVIALFTILICGCYPHNKTIIIQPMGDFSPALAAVALSQVQAIDPGTILRPAMPLPLAAWYKPRSRYRADTLIRFLGSIAGRDTIVIGITDKDISTSKGNVTDWGVMGLGYCPGSSCVVSTFRLSPKDLRDQFYKVAVHELGHTLGLPHCPKKTCFMRDAEGGNPLNEETGFCPSCKKYLRNKGWSLK